MLGESFYAGTWDTTLPMGESIGWHEEGGLSQECRISRSDNPLVEGRGFFAWYSPKNVKITRSFKRRNEPTKLLKINDRRWVPSSE
jgi:hypothetical protein